MMFTSRGVTNDKVASCRLASEKCTFSNCVMTAGKAPATTRSAIANATPSVVVAARLGNLSILLRMILDLASKRAAARASTPDPFWNIAGRGGASASAGTRRTARQTENTAPTLTAAIAIAHALASVVTPAENSRDGK